MEGAGNAKKNISRTTCDETADVADVVELIVGLIQLIYNTLGRRYSKL